MGETLTSLPPASVEKRLAFFERYLSLWVALCMVAGLIAGKIAPAAVPAIRGLEFGQSSQINVPIAVLIWLMITPMMMKVDFGAVRNVGRKPAGTDSDAVRQLAGQAVFHGTAGVVLLPARLRPVHFRSRSRPVHCRACIILAAAPCTAMVFVWSHLTNGDPAYTLVQVSVNDLIMLVAFVPIVQFLVTGASSLTVPFRVLLYSVVVFIVIPLAAGTIIRQWLIRSRGKEWFETRLLPRFAPVTITALLATLVCIFAFQADNITGRFFHVLLIAVPITLQVYFNSSLAYGLMRLLKVEHSVAAPGALIGASNFFELAVATAIALFGPDSGAALATVVGVLVEVPVMLSVCAACNRTRHWFSFQTAR